jgi:hypothetical protein
LCCTQKKKSRIRLEESRKTDFLGVQQNIGYGLPWFQLLGKLLKKYFRKICFEKQNPMVTLDEKICVAFLQTQIDVLEHKYAFASDTGAWLDLSHLRKLSQEKFEKIQMDDSHDNIYGEGINETPAIKGKHIA